MGRRDGFTFMELLLTIVVIASGMIGVMALFENATRGALQADLNGIATNLAHEKLERVVLDKARLGYATINDTMYPDEAMTGDYNVFSRRTRVTEVSGTDLSTALAGSGYKRIEVTVSWGTGSNRQIMIPTVLSSY